MSSVRPLPSPVAGPAPASVDRRLLAFLARRVGEAARLRYAIGPASAGAAEPVATVRFADRRALLGLLRDPEVGFGDAYADGRVDIEGDLVAALEEASRAAESRPAGVLSRLSLLERHRPARARENVHRHYDLGNAFYAEWLDRALVYTCAYFETPAQSLDDAQQAKLDLVCRKLALRPGERVLEAGCGWGALARHMARRYGVRVTACNLSREQVAFARARARDEGLEGAVDFREADYRQVEGTFDVFVSVGMLEHVGRRSYPELARVIDRSLPPGRGRGLLHFIGRDRPRPLNAWIRRRIFPGAYPPTLDEVVRSVLRPAGATVTDVENLRPHYALTLDHWRRRYEHAVAAGRIGFDERFRRAWRLYLAGSQAAFSTGWLELFQVVFTRRGDDALPWTRAPIYAGGPR
jgi:cyclopropane-fatty-acyl-phospholipid synthase